MDVDGKAGALLQGLNQLVGRIGAQKACHILDAEGIGSHVLYPLCKLLPVVQGIGVSQGVAQGDLGVASFLLGGLYRGLQVPYIIQAVEDPDDVDAVCHGLLYEVLHHVVCVMVVSQDVLSPEKHLKLRVLEACSQLSQPLPGVLLQESQGSVKGGAAPALYCIIADLVHLLHDGKHLLRGHPGGDEGLVGVS